MAQIQSKAILLNSKLTRLYTPTFFLGQYRKIGRSVEKGGGWDNPISTEQRLAVVEVILVVGEWMVVNIIFSSKLCSGELMKLNQHIWINKALLLVFSIL